MSLFSKDPLRNEAMIYPPPKRDSKIIVHIPSSVINVEKGILKKTFIVGLLGRACGIFRVDIIDIYVDPDSNLEDALFIKKILEYMTTPSYLRKYLISLDKNLRGVGVLPPLATPNQPSQEIISGRHFREALVVDLRKDTVYLEAGLGELVSVHLDKERLKNIKRGDRVVIEVDNNNVVSILPREEFMKKFYWVFQVSISKSLRESLRKFRGSVIISSRKGEYMDDRVAKKLIELYSRGDLSVVFGSPSRDPDEIADIEGWDINKMANLVINTAPLQGVRSIRTYEALYITLSLINNTIYISKKL
ncbi:MAG: putative RNA uridine N3 methyltransferase [Sulfolobales archaeon]